MNKKRNKFRRNLKTEKKGFNINREQLQKEQARERHLQLTAEGKTDQARSDLARLAIIRKQREDAKKKKDAQAAETQAKKGESLQAGKSLIGKSLGKK